VEFRILGPLEVAACSQRLDLGGVRQQMVLATLLLSANNVVTLGRLQEAVYGEDLPPTSRSQVQTSISSLRRLFAAHGHPTVVATREQGYVIQVDAGQLDFRRFEELLAAAHAARDQGHLDRAVAGYRDALRLWQGPALDGLDSQLLRAAASRLDEQRIAAIEDRLTLELDLGRHHELVGELAELVEEFSLRERLRGQLMLALYRCDRTAEALSVYRQTRRTMIDELGIEPSERLQRLEHAILTGDPALDMLAGPVTIQPVRQPVRQRVPSLLPADIADFTGRAGQVAQIGQHLTDQGEGRVAPPVVVITGQGGVGKTSLAVRAAHEVAGEFPDGQLFADLHAGTGQPVGPMQVLERFLRALGVPGQQIPEGLDERAEVYRDLLAGRKVLVVLDDVAGESQVLPLLPGSAAAAMMITSRHRLGGLAGATHIEVGVFFAEASLELLGRIAGTGRVQAQSQAAAAVAGQCGHLPLALRVAGARLAERPHWAVQQLADRLADETRRLDELRHGDLAVRPSISLSYNSASEQARRLLRRLAIVEAPVFSGWVGAALLGQVAAGEEALDELVSARLVEAVGTGSGVHSQYRLHDLIRVYARERLAAEEQPTERTAALERVLGAWLYLAKKAGNDSTSTRMRSDAALWPLPGLLAEQLVSDPMAWYERERAALVSGVRQAARAGFADLCWELAFTAATLFETRAYFDDWRETHEIALHAARQAGDVRGQATILYALGSLHMRQGQYDLAREELTMAERLFQDAADDRGLAIVTVQIAAMDRQTGRFDDAVRRSQQALPILRTTGDLQDLAYLLRNLAQVKLELGQLDYAKELLAEALRLAQAERDSLREAGVLNQLGRAYLLAGELARAVGMLDLALAKARDIGAISAEMYILISVGAVKTRLGESGQARGALQRALELARTMGDRLAEAQALSGLAEQALASGDPGQAAVLAGQAVAGCRKLRARPDEARALTLLGVAHTALGDSAAADAASAQAAALRAKLAGGAAAP
jgi:DNA-binding SARP family transcriptional activator/tetratricopeptide (TPR) repeat protein